jgi:membrane protease YdiL (CAAX protease family)
VSNGIETVPVAEASPAEIPANPPADPSDKRLRWLELSLVLTVCFADSILGSLGILKDGPSAVRHTSQMGYAIGLVHQAAGLTLLGYVLWRRKIRIASLGLRWSFADLGRGVLVAGLAYLAYAGGHALLHLFDNAARSQPQSVQVARAMFGHPSILAIPYTIVNPFFEELIVRAYLMTEVSALTGSWILAAALSIVVQFSYHLYYGWEGAIGLSFVFLVYAIYYARTQKATPIIVAHGIFDILAFVRLW